MSYASYARFFPYRVLCKLYGEWRRKHCLVLASKHSDQNNDSFSVEDNRGAVQEEDLTGSDNEVRTEKVTSSDEEGDIQDDEKDSKIECKAVCCNPERETPNQPTSSQVLAATRRSQGKQTRSVQPSWFKQYPWLTLCESRKTLFCFYCSRAEHKNIITFSTKADVTFSKGGFSNWKKAGERLKKYESSQAHQKAYMKICSPGNIAAVLDAALKNQQVIRQRMLLKQLSSLKYLVRQGLAIRGHNDSEGNLIQLLKVLNEDDPDLKVWLSEAKYLSPLIINEQIKLFGDHLLRHLLTEIRETPFFLF